MKKLYFVAFVLIINAQTVFAGQWLPDTGIHQIEARDGSWFSVILKSTDSLCPSNRVIFRNGTYTNQEGVNHHYSLLLAATMASKTVSIHIEIVDAQCIGRISFVRP